MDLKKNNIDKKIIDFLRKDGIGWLFLIFIIGLVLRIIFASNVTPVADEVGHGILAAGVVNDAPLSTTAQAAIWYYLTDFIYNMVGISLLSSRMLSVIFGSLSIILVYLIGKQIFNFKIGLISAALLAFSTYHIDWSSVYHDQTMMFFVLFAMYFFIKEYKSNKTISILSGLMLGIAFLVKIIAAGFIIVFAVFGIAILVKNYKSNKDLFKINLKRTLIIILILLLSTMPILVYNYFLYKEKGIVDGAFAQFLGINREAYSGMFVEEGFVLYKLGHNLGVVLNLYFLREDLLLTLIASVGLLIFLFTIKKDTFIKLFLISSFIFVLLFIASAIALQTHYTSFIPLMSLFGAFALSKTTEKIKKVKYRNYLVYGVIILMLVTTVYTLRDGLTSKSAIEKVRAYTERYADDKTLIIADGRIYRGTTAWMLNGKKYLEASYFPKILEISDSSKNKNSIKTLFVECINDDCGWGTIRDQTEFNQSMEHMVEIFKNISIKTVNIEGGGSIRGIRGDEIRGEEYFTIYEGYINLDPVVLSLVDQTHSHLYHNLPRDRDPKGNIDYYEVKGNLNKIINFLAYTILYSFTLLAVISIPLLFYFLFKEGSNLE